MGIAVKYKNRRSPKIAHILIILNGAGSGGGALPEHEGCDKFLLDSVNIWMKAAKSSVSGHFKCS